MSTAPLRLYHGLTALAPWLLGYAARKAHAKQGAEPARLGERFGKTNLERPLGPLIWLHAASVGEVQSMSALAPLLAARANLLVTTTTQTGANRAKDVMPRATLHQFLPVDTAQAVEQFLDHWQPDLALFAEGDVWPRMSTSLAKRHVPAALLNARASRSRSRFPSTSRTLLAPFKLLTTQSEEVLSGLADIGLDPAKLAYLGDLKAGLPAAPAPPEALSVFQTATQGRPVWAAVSTHEADETAVLTAQQVVLAAHPEALLMWLPRHPTRADLIEAGTSLPLARRSRGEVPDAKTAIYLVDTLGEAGAAHATAPLVFLGGSFGANGGHNPYEPARTGAFVLHGPHVANFAAAYTTLARDGYAAQVTSAAELGAVVSEKLSAQSERLKPWADQDSSEAAQRTFARLEALLRTQP